MNANSGDVVSESDIGDVTYIPNNFYATHSYLCCIW